MVPSSICLLQHITKLQINTAGTDLGIQCVPACVSSISVISIPTTTCPSNQDIGLCGLISATNVYSISGYSQWNCTTLGKTLTNPCSSPVWNGIACGSGITNNSVISITLSSLGMTGKE